MRFPVFFALLLTLSSAIAQTAGLQSTDDPPRDAAKLAAARCAYAQMESTCAAFDGPGHAPSTHSTELAQGPRQFSGPQRWHAIAGPGYPMWTPQPSGRHALIGGLIGFGFGAAAGAKNGGVGASLGFGALLGAIGAGIGSTIPSFPSPSRYHHHWPDYGGEDDEANSYRPIPPSKSDSSAHLEARSRQKVLPHSPQRSVDSRKDAPQAQTP